MQIRRVEIKHFRGIESFTWDPPGKIACLVGPGDSAKTTILEAIELALIPRWDPILSDVDFFGLDTSVPVEITVTVAGLPDALQHEDKFGRYLGGWHPQLGLLDEPAGDAPGVLSIRLTIDEHLEPTWVAFTTRPDLPERLVRPGDREAIGCARIGANVAWDLTWSRRSALSRAEGKPKEARPHLTAALRTARQSMASAHLPGLQEVATKVEALAKKLGVSPAEALRPGLSPLSISLRHGALSLHDGSVPLTSAGLGTQRLSAVAVQQLSVPEGAILLLDEVEHGLEPHRLRHLLRLLRDDTNIGQVLMTSHSATTIEELETGELSVVRRSPAGVVRVQSVASDLQATVRYASEALLSRSVLVCEGKTETGLIRSWDASIWQGAGYPPVAQCGTFPIPGGGHEAVARALDLHKLGYRVALFRDGDTQLEEHDRQQLDAAGVTIFEWADRLNTEQRICRDLPWASLQILVHVASAERSPRTVARAIARFLGQVTLPLTTDLDALAASGVTEPDLRAAIALAATSKGTEWFKRIDLGERLGNIVAHALPQLDGTDLAAMISALRDWAHGS